MSAKSAKAEGHNLDFSRIVLARPKKESSGPSLIEFTTEVAASGGEGYQNLVEDPTQARDDPNEGLTFGDMHPAQQSPLIRFISSMADVSEARAMHLHALRALRCGGPTCVGPAVHAGCADADALRVAMKVTFIDYEASWVTWFRPRTAHFIALSSGGTTARLRLLAIVVWFSLGWMAFWVLPLLWPAFKARSPQLTNLGPPAHHTSGDVKSMESAARRVVMFVPASRMWCTTVPVSVLVLLTRCDFECRPRMSLHLKQAVRRG